MMTIGPSRRPVSDECRRAAWALRQIHMMFNKELRRDIPAQYITSFLLVVEEEGLSVNEYAERAGVSKSVMSRHLLDIGDRTRHMEPGFGLITSRPKQEDYRTHEVLLTAKGRAMAERICEFWRHSQEKGGK
jgi:DNA-binding MarR family transcriptional regulator